jgi:FtsZ-binding cell division protein ZapB
LEIESVSCKEIETKKSLERQIQSLKEKNLLLENNLEVSTSKNYALEQELQLYRSNSEHRNTTIFASQDIPTAVAEKENNDSIVIEENKARRLPPKLRSQTNRLKVKNQRNEKIDCNQQ